MSICLYISVQTTDNIASRKVGVILALAIYIYIYIRMYVYIYIYIRKVLYVEKS